MPNYHYRLSIIVGILFAAGWMQSSEAVLSDDEKIQYLVISLEHARSRGLVTADGINHFEKWAFWDYTPKNFRLNCATKFCTKMENAGMDYNSKNRNRLSELAYAALDENIRENAIKAKDLVDHDRKITPGIDRIVNGGKYLHMKAFFAEKFRSESVQEVADILRRMEPNVDENMAVKHIVSKYVTYNN